MKIGLTLGGGGARGAAHIGVLMELERLRIRPHLITGTSIGGLVGALYAAGQTPEQMLAFFQKLGVGQLYALPGSHPSLSSNNKAEKLLEESIGRISFTDLKIPLAVVTTNLITRKEVILDEGDVISAVLATIAFPILLPPVERGGQLLVDGGVINNVPFDVARARGATQVIAVDLSLTAPFGSHPEPETQPMGIIARALAITQRNRTLQILSAVVDMLTVQSLNARLAISQPDILIRPKLGTIGLLDFHRWQEGVTAGKSAVSEIESQLTSLQTP